MLRLWVLVTEGIPGEKGYGPWPFWLKPTSTGKAGSSERNQEGSRLQLLALPSRITVRGVLRYVKS